VTSLEMLCRYLVEDGATPAPETALAEMSQRSGVPLPASFALLYSKADGGIVARTIPVGPHAGERVEVFWSSGRILDELTAEQGGASLPFAEDAFGNWFALVSYPTKVEVVLMDWSRRRMEAFGTFDDFIDSLAD
jgi:hypothetical protein